MIDDRYDISYCLSDCGNKNCFRHMANAPSLLTGLSFIDGKGTIYCEGWQPKKGETENES